MREVEGLPIALDFLVEGRSGGGRIVDDVHASSFLGVQRALDSKVLKTIQGRDAFQVSKEFEIPVASLGPLIVLKLNAFASRRQPKDAFDLMTLCLLHPRASLLALTEEADQGNPGYPVAVECLETFFQSAESDGPRRALSFSVGELRGRPSDAEQQILERMATMGQFLLG